jgi:tRNA (guanine37-N1)-methyltransferase
MTRLRIEVVTIFPELIEAFARVGLVGKAVETGQLRVSCVSPREFAHDKHRSVDDAPFGGGSGMLMTPEPLVSAMEALDARAHAAGDSPARRVLLTPHGAPFAQGIARRLAAESALMLVCGRYEGVDERVRGFVQEEISLGDFVVQGGEVPAMAVIEAVSRCVPGVLGNAASIEEESHADGVLEYPQYTRPRSFRGMEVPEVLVGGDHAEIARWRRREALQRTRDRRPDLFARLVLSEEDRRLLEDGAERLAGRGKGT